MKIKYLSIIMYLPYDVLFNIFFHIDDYQTILAFYTLDKYFYNNYMSRYSITYKHKFGVLFNEIFSFLKMLPYVNQQDDDINIFMCIKSMCIEPIYKPIIRNDIMFIYKLYKSLIYEESFRKLGSNIAPDLTNIILIQGPNHIDRNTCVRFKKNKVKITLSEGSRILELNLSLNFAFLRRRFQLLEGTG